MHILSERHRSEFLAVPQLVRMTMGSGRCGFEPTVLIKTLSLSLKYLISSRELRILLIRLPGGYLGYGMSIDRDPDHPGFLWSVMETEDERSALRAMATGSRCVVFLFNELVLNVAWTEIVVHSDDNEIVHWIDHAALALEADQSLHDFVSTKLDAYAMGKILDDIHTLKSNLVDEWTEIRNSYITNRLKTSNISAFHPDEGDQQ